MQGITYISAWYQQIFIDCGSVIYSYEKWLKICNSHLSHCNPLWVMVVGQICKCYDFPLQTLSFKIDL